MWLLDYAAGFLSRPPVVRRFDAHLMTPGPGPLPAAPVSAPAGPMSTGEGGSGPASCARATVMDRLTGNVAEYDHAFSTPAPSPVLEMAADGLHRCEEITHQLTDKRPYPIRCHNLPRGHSGRCEPYPTARRMGIEWHTAMATRIRALEDLEEAERP